MPPPLPPPSTAPPRSRLLAILALALGLRAALPDWGRLLPPLATGQWPPGGAFDGHERGYVLAFLGRAPDPSTQAWPLLCAIYRGLGALSGDPRLLTGLSILAGSLSCLLLAIATGRRFGASAGTWAGVLAALLPEHLAWSSSALNVALPLALLLGALVVRPAWAKALLVILAVSMRAELALLAPGLGLPGLVGLPVAAAWLWALPSPELGDPLLALRVNLPLVRFLGPPALLIGLLALFPGGRALPGASARRAAPLLAFAAWTHLVAAAFVDQGFRHELAGGLALCALGGIAAARWRGLPGLVIAALLAWEDAGLPTRWYARPPMAAEALDLPAQAPPDCVELSEEPPIRGQALPSHLALWTGEVDGCALWGEARAHGGWSSRGLHDRALRMRTLYRLTPVAIRPDPGGPIVLHRLERRW